MLLIGNQIETLNVNEQIKGLAKSKDQSKANTTTAPESDVVENATKGSQHVFREHKHTTNHLKSRRCLATAA